MLVGDFAYPPPYLRAPVLACRDARQITTNKSHDDYNCNYLVGLGPVTLFWNNFL